MIVRYLICLILILLTGCGTDKKADNTSEYSATSDCMGMNSEACEVFDLTNLERSRAGLPMLSISSECVAASQSHAEDMDNNNFFSHDGLGETYESRMQRFQVPGFNGENIADAGPEASMAISIWMNSQGHRENILNTGFTHAGMGYSNGMWVQCFTSP